MATATPDASQEPRSPRVLIYSGKGGVGKTTVAAATALRCAREGKRTLVISVDVAHSLGDAFDVTEAMRDAPRGRPFQVEPGLEIQEIDVQEEVFLHWDQVFRYFSVLFAETGMDDVMAEELALFPGMEDVVALLYLNRYVREGNHDVVILDLAPTGESLRFVSMPNTIDWYMRKVFRFERNLAKMARPLAKRLARLPLPEDAYFKAIEGIWSDLEGVDKVLVDPLRTSVRLVTNAEKMVVKETERAHLYFSLHGMHVDSIIVNKVLTELPQPEDLPEALRSWVDTHRTNLDRIATSFAGIPIQALPLQPDEVVGSERLAAVGDALYGTGEAAQDPLALRRTKRPLEITADAGSTTVRIYLPNLEKKELDIWVEDTEMIVRVGSQKRHVPLPRRLRDLSPASTGYGNDHLVVRFDRTAIPANEAPPQ